MLLISRNSKNGCVSIFTKTDVQKCLQSLNSSQCLEPDEIPNFLSKKCTDVLCYPFASIFNRSFSTNLIEIMWRKMKIILISKKVSGHRNGNRNRNNSNFSQNNGKIITTPTSTCTKRANWSASICLQMQKGILDAAVVLNHNIVFNLEKGRKYVRCAFLN